MQRRLSSYECAGSVSPVQPGVFITALCTHSSLARFGPQGRTSAGHCEQWPKRDLMSADAAARTMSHGSTASTRHGACAIRSPATTTRASRLYHHRAPVGVRRTSPASDQRGSRRRRVVVMTHHRQELFSRATTRGSRRGPAPCWPRNRPRPPRRTSNGRAISHCQATPATTAAASDVTML